MRIFTILIGLFLAAGGFYLFLTPVSTFYSIGWFIGVLLLVTGINIIVDHFILKKNGIKGAGDLIGGALTILLAVLIIYSQFARLALDSFIIVAFGAWVFISGIIRIFVSMQHKKSGEKVWIWIFILGVISVFLGIYGFVNPAMFKMAIGMMVGFFITMQGINMIGLGISLGGKKS